MQARCPPPSRTRNRDPQNERLSLPTAATGPAVANNPHRTPLAARLLARGMDMRDPDLARGERACLCAKGRARWDAGVWGFGLMGVGGEGVGERVGWKGESLDGMRRPGARNRVEAGLVSE